MTNPTDKRASNVFAEALRFSDLDQTLATIMSAVGIQTGDLAGQCFNDNDRKTYTALKGSAGRAEFIATWLRYELFDAAWSNEPEEIVTYAVTFEDFQATAKRVEDIRVIDGWQDYEGAARVYLDVLVIEEPKPGVFQLLIGNMIHTGETLEALERRLYEWACDEGYFDDAGDKAMTKSYGRS